MTMTRLMAVALLSLSASIHGLPVAAQVLGAPPSVSTVSEVDAGEQDRVLWTAASLERLLAARDYPSVLVLSALSRPREERDGSALGALDPVLRALAADRAEASNASLGLSTCRQEEDASRGVLCAMERLVPAASPAFARDLTEQGARLVGLSSQPARSGAALRGLGGFLVPVPAVDPLQGFTEEALAGVWRARDGASSGFDEILSQVVGLAPGAGVESVVGVAPGLRGLLDAYPVLPQLGSGAAALGPTHHYQAFLGDLTSSLPGLVAGGGTVGEARQQWAASRSFVYLAAHAAELSGSGRGVADRIRALGTAAVDLQREAAEFPRTLSSMGRDLAATALTGNVLGIVSGITSFFGGASGGLGPEAAREVRAVRAGIESMRGELLTGFDGLDHRVDEMVSRLEVLEGLVASNGRDVRRDLAALHESVLDLDERLGWMDANIRSYVQAGFDRDYTRTLVRCLEHRERYAPPRDEMDFAVFSECLADFRARAVVDASDALLTDQSTALDDVSLIEVLSVPSLADLSFRLPLLGRVADERFGYPGLAGGFGLANLVEWRIASEAYLTLLEDWPEHARAVRPGDLEAMRAVGLALRSALQSISDDGAGRAPLIAGVLGYYAGRLQEVTAESDSLARRHRQQTLVRVDPASVLTRVEHVDGTGPALDVPDEVARQVPTVLSTAAVLGLDGVSLVYKLTSEDSVIRANSRRAFLFFGRRHDRFTYTRTRMQIELRSTARGTIGRFELEGPFVMRATEEMNGDERSDEVRRRVDHVADAADHFLTAAWPMLAADPASWRAEPVADGVESDFEAEVERALRRHATAGLHNVFASVCSDVPRNGLSGDDRASALRIRNALSGMSAARVLLEAYLRLASPDAVESSAALRASLTGPDAILDRGRLCSVVASGESPLRLIWLEEEPRRRLAELRAVVDGVVEAERENPGTLVDSTLEQLDAAIRVQLLRAAVAVR